MKFLVQWVSDERLATLVARQLEPGTFEVFDDSRLDGRPLMSELDVPRRADDESSRRDDLFAFYLRNKGDVGLFKLGQVVELTRGDAHGTETRGP